MPRGPMRIGIDARKLHDFGIGTYLQNLLKELVRLPTVSAQGSAIDETASAVLARARRAGLAAEALRVSGGAPTVVGGPGRGPRALLVYDHYAVQAFAAAGAEMGNVLQGCSRSIVQERVRTGIEDLMRQR